MKIKIICYNNNNNNNKALLFKCNLLFIMYMEWDNPLYIFTAISLYTKRQNECNCIVIVSYMKLK